ncbi:hypothetical protein Bbelb_036460 [Branchiostoma belcheri]|nr:hypothetical protein Bbelb_036460 [Branchiostoma belcheri]
MSIWETKYSKSMHMELMTLRKELEEMKETVSRIQKGRTTAELQDEVVQYARRAWAAFDPQRAVALLQTLDMFTKLDRKKCGDEAKDLTEREEWILKSCSFLRPLIRHKPQPLKSRLEALENAHRTEGVREALEQVLDLPKAPSHLNHALLIPALRGLEEKARAAGQAGGLYGLPDLRGYAQAR